MKKDLVSGLAWGGGLIALALAASFARSQGYIDAETVNRIVMGAIGLMVAWYGNRLPKSFVPSHAAAKAARVGGWSMALSGLVYAGLWVFAPPSVAVIAGCAAIIAGMLVTMVYCLSLRERAPLG